MSTKKEKEKAPEVEGENLSQIPSTEEEFQSEETTPETSLDLETLKIALAEAQAQAAEYKDGWQRTMADFQNYKRRTESERMEAYQLALGNVIKRYLPILDDLELALASHPENLPWVNGIELIYRKLKTILENEGLKRIEAEGHPFDPNFHEAVSQESVKGVESGQVVAITQQGYMLGDRVIRPARVRVAE